MARIAVLEITMMGLVHGLMVAGLMATASATPPGAGASAPLPVRFICNAEGRCFENGDLGDRYDRDDEDREERRRERHRHEDDDEE